MPIGPGPLCETPAPRFGAWAASTFRCVRRASAAKRPVHAGSSLRPANHALPVRCEAGRGRHGPGGARRCWRRRGASLRLAATLSLQDRLSPCARVRLEAGDDFLRDLPLEQSLDVTQEFVLVDADQ
jgi:hypothetical protein